MLWITASYLFSWYAANFGSFNKTYGSLGAIVGFMVWIWISMIVVLLGAAVDASIKQRGTRPQGPKNRCANGRPTWLTLSGLRRTRSDAWYCSRGSARENTSAAACARGDLHSRLTDTQTARGLVRANALLFFKFI